MYIMTVIALFLEYASFHLSSMCASLVVREHSAYIILYLSLSRTLLRKIVLMCALDILVHVLIDPIFCKIELLYGFRLSFVFHYI